jgi:hypothetical protein
MYCKVRLGGQKKQKQEMGMALKKKWFGRRGKLNEKEKAEKK